MDVAGGVARSGQHQIGPGERLGESLHEGDGSADAGVDGVASVCMAEAGLEGVVGRAGCIQREGMGGEDFPFLTTEPYIPSAYFAIGGTPKESFEREAAGGPPVPSHHSPLFEIAPEPAVRSGVIATVIALRELMPAKK